VRVKDELTHVEYELPSKGGKRGVYGIRERGEGGLQSDRLTKSILLLKPVLDLLLGAKKKKWVWCSGEEGGCAT